MNETPISDKLIHLLNNEIIEFNISDKKSYQPLLDKIGEARIVLMGEATHGTEEFYRTRNELSKLLITEKNFQAITIEGDWTSTYNIHHYIQGNSNSTDEALSDFQRFPLWMWRNTTLPPFLKWLRDFNDQTSTDKIHFYGLDLYSLEDSIQAVIDYLEKHDPKAATQAKKRYACFEYLDPQAYGYAIETGAKKACITQVTEQLLAMQRLAFDKFHQYHLPEDELIFCATQNARIVKNAEHYYRALFESRENTWNIRDEHMMQTLENIMIHLETKTQKPAKIIIWAHNSHIGDARATEMSNRNEINLGQLVRERFSANSYHLGFSTHSGTVAAADNWGDSMQTKNVVPGMPGSFENIFHKLDKKNFILDLHSDGHLQHLLEVPFLQRAIGVIYRPENERWSHYFFTRLPFQFDALIHFDKSTAVTPLD